MSRVDNTLPKHHFLFAQKKDPPPGLWDPLAGLFKKKVVPIEPIAPLPVEVPAPNVPAILEAPSAVVLTIPSPIEVPAPGAPITPEVPAPEIPSVPESIPEIPLPPSSILDQVEILPAVGVEQEIQNIALDSIDATPIPAALPITAAVSVISPIENPSTLPASFSRKVYGMLNLRNFTYLALLATAIAFIYFFYTRVWQKKPIPQQEPTPPLEEKNVLLLELPALENLPQLSIEKEPPIVVNQEPKNEWLSKGIVGGIGVIGGFIFSYFNERRNRQSFTEELFRQADLKYVQLNTQFVTQSDLSSNTDFARAIPSDPELAQAIQKGIPERIDQIKQTIDQLKDLKQQNRDLPNQFDLEALKEQLKELQTKVNPDQFKKLGETIAQLKNEMTALIGEESSKNQKFAQELQELRDKIDQLSKQQGNFDPGSIQSRFDDFKAASVSDREAAIKQLKQEIEIQLTENRNSIIEQLRSEISTMKECEGSKNTELARQLEQVSEQLGKLSGQMDAFEAQKFLEKLELVKNASTKDKEEAIALLKQEFAVQIQQAIFQIRNEFQRLNNENTQEISALNVIIERNFELGIVKFDEVKKLIEAIRSEDKIFVTSALQEQNNRLDTLQAKIQASISEQVQEMFDSLKINIDERLSKLNPAHLSEVEKLRASMPQDLGENSDSVTQLESILKRLAELENKESNNSAPEANLLIVEMKATLQKSREIDAQLVSLQERIQRNSDSSLEGEVRDLLRIMSVERMLAFKQFSALENRVREVNAAIEKLRIDHNNLESAHRSLDSRFMRAGASISKDNSPNRLDESYLTRNSQDNPLLGEQRFTSDAFARNLSSTSVSPAAAKDTSSQGSREARIRQFRNTYSQIIEPHAEDEYTPISSGDILKYLKGRTSVHRKYEVKIDQEIYFVRTDKIDSLADDFLKVTPVTETARKHGNPMALGAGLHSAEAQKLIAERDSPSKMDSTVTPERSRRLSLSTVQTRKSSVVEKINAP